MTEQEYYIKEVVDRELAPIIERLSKVEQALKNIEDKATVTTATKTEVETTDEDFYYNRGD
jgi:hypothetical protein